MEEPLMNCFEEYFFFYHDEPIELVRSDAMKTLTGIQTSRMTHIREYLLESNRFLHEKRLETIKMYGNYKYCQFIEAVVDNCIARGKYPTQPEVVEAQIRFSIRRAYQEFKKFVIIDPLEYIANDVYLALNDYRYTSNQNQPMTGMYNLIQQEIFIAGDAMIGIFVNSVRFSEEYWNQMITEEIQNGARVLICDNDEDTIFQS